jgi:signal transduction histidine kinase
MSARKPRAVKVPLAPPRSPSADESGEGGCAAPSAPDFLDLMAHELRSPVATISAAAELLLAGDPPPETSQLLDVILQEVGRLTSLVEGMLAVGRAPKGQVTVTLEPVTLRSLGQRAVARAAVAHSGRAFRVEVADDVPPVMADPGCVDQIVCNLLQNAAKYSPAGSEIVLCASAVDGGQKVRCQVTDSGLGIAEDELGRIFESGHRAPAAGRQGIEGRGLGLFIARWLVEAQGGRIWAENRPGGGARVVFELPAAVGGPAPSPAA